MDYVRKLRKTFFFFFLLQLANGGDYMGSLHNWSPLSRYSAFLFSLFVSEISLDWSNLSLYPLSIYAILVQFASTPDPAYAGSSIVIFHVYKYITTFLPSSIFSHPRHVRLSQLLRVILTRCSLRASAHERLFFLCNDRANCIAKQAIMTFNITQGR
jgi:hypothetical protein